MLDTSSIIAIFDQHTQAEAAHDQLQQGGFDLKKLSIVSEADHSKENVGSGKFMLVVSGTPDDFIRAREILSTTGTTDAQMHVPDALIGLASSNLVL